MADLRCPQCGTQVSENDFACASCQLILNFSSATGAYTLTQPSIVRALLSPADFSGVRAIPKPPPAEHVHEKVTVRATVIMDEHTVPKLTAGLDVAVHPLLPFEAQVASYLDGRTSVPEVARLADLSVVETHAVLRSLLQRRVIELHRTDPERAEKDREKARRTTAAELPAQPAPAKAKATESALPRVSAPPTPVAEEPEDTAPDGPPPIKRRTTQSLPAAVAQPPPIRRTTQSLPAVQPPPIKRTTTQNLPRAATPAPTPVPLDLLPDVPTPTHAHFALSPRSEASAAEIKRTQTSSAPLADPAANVLERAIALEREGDVGRAIETLKRAIAKSKEPAPIYNKLALILLNQRSDRQQAEELLRQALDLDPDNPVYRENLLRVLALGADQPQRPRGFLGKLLGRKE